MSSQAASGKILIADDDPAIVEALTMILEDEGYVIEGTHGRETIMKVSIWAPDLLFLDMWMPDMNGREICEQLKRRERTRDIPIIMLSASKDAEVIARAAGADTFLPKPFELERVLAVAKQYIQRG
ncbi:MAG TPA: response regulator [Ktedonobacterales bacterium]|jgi:CheY-like chemotaxis protein|nr:response regulator [Ktedonobacterales bacterium]